MTAEDNGHSFSVVIPTRDRPADLRRCLESIVAQNRRPAQVVVVDDGHLAFDALKPLVEQAGIEWTYLRKDRLDRNRARNLGVAASTHPIVAFLDDDVALEKDYFEQLIGALERFRRVGVAGATACVRSPRPMPWTRWPVHAAERFFGLRGRRLCGLLSSGFCADFDETDHIGNEPFDVDYSSAGSCAYFRDICRQYPYPEGYAFLAAGDDKMLGLSVSRHWRTLFVPRARLTHYHAPGARPSKATEGERRLLGMYWTWRRFVRPTPLGTLRFLWGCAGLMTIGLSGALIRMSGRHWAYAGGVFRGFGKALSYWARGVTFQDAVDEAARRNGEIIETPVGLDSPLPHEPQELPIGGGPKGGD
ncbi:MAG: glycosyltransferase family 2 protein [Candidatus Sumerlaeota bacterium]|nr:glycosyltransferase family 2 protein [Candidatus Sumerlaeota bacterium]